MSVESLQYWRVGVSVFVLAGALGSAGAVAAGQGTESEQTVTSEAMAGTSQLGTALPGARNKLDKLGQDPLGARPQDLDDPQLLPGDHWAESCATPVVPSHPLLLAEAVDLALCRNPQVRAAWAGVKAGAASLGEAKSAYLPTLAASISRVRDRTSYAGAGAGAQSLQDTSRNLSLNWRLFDFGARDANRAAASAILDAALATHDATLQRLLDSVIGAYFDAQTAKANWLSRQQIEQLARKTLETAARREASGAGSQTDTLQANTALARASLERSRAAGDSAKAMAVLVYALGLQPGASIDLADDLADSKGNVEQELAEWLSQAQARHPAILAARSQLQAARQRVVTVRAEGLPTVDLGVNQYRNGRPNQGLPSVQSNERVVALTVSVPIFDGFARGYKSRNAQAQAEQKEAELGDLEHQVLMGVVKAHADALASFANLSASNELHQAAVLAMASARRRMEKGATDVLELLTAQSALADAEQQRIRCLAEWRSARLRLFAAVGRLGREELNN